MTAFHTIAIPHDDILHRRVPSYILGVNFLAGRDRVQQEVEKAKSKGDCCKSKELRKNHET